LLRAAELALAAICVQLDCVPDRKYVCLPDYFDSLGKNANAKGAVQEADYVGELHAVRSNAQLRALPVDAWRWSRAKRETLEHVATWCQEFLGLGLFELDSVAVLPPQSVPMGLLPRNTWVLSPGPIPRSGALNAPDPRTSI